MFLILIFVCSYIGRSHLSAAQNRPLSKSERSIFHGAYINYLLHKKTYEKVKKNFDSYSTRGGAIYAYLKGSIKAQFRNTRMHYIILLVGMELASKKGDDFSFQIIILKFNDGTKITYTINNSDYRKHFKNANKLMNSIKLQVKKK